MELGRGWWDDGQIRPETGMGMAAEAAMESYAPPEPPDRFRSEETHWCQQGSTWGKGTNVTPRRHLALQDTAAAILVLLYLIPELSIWLPRLSVVKYTLFCCNMKF